MWQCCWNQQQVRVGQRRRNGLAQRKQQEDSLCWPRSFVPLIPFNIVANLSRSIVSPISLPAVFMKRLVCDLLLVGALSVSVVAWARSPLLLVNPTLSRTPIPISYAADLCLLPRERR